jgi:hypothetical protein
MPLTQPPVAHDPKHIEAELDSEIAADAAPTPTSTPASMPAPAPESAAIEITLNALLDTPTPDDWNDPVMTSLRTNTLAYTASRAGECMIELLVRLYDERSRDVHMHEGNCVLTTTDALFGLHRALCAYTRDTMRHDGEVVACGAITRAHGAGIATLTMHALAELRGLIAIEMRSAHRRR